MAITTPTEAPMTRAAMADWMRMRGVDDGAYLDALLVEYAGRTEDELDAIYDAMHGC